MIENAATGALLLIGGGRLSPLCVRSWCRNFATSRVSILARLSQRRLCLGRQTLSGIHVGADTP